MKEECRKLQQDLISKKKKFNKMCANMQNDLQATLYEELPESLMLSMELDTKEGKLMVREAER